jgi:hypothetical protein
MTERGAVPHAGGALVREVSGAQIGITEEVGRATATPRA